MSVTFLLTTDAELLSQYHALRHESYHNDKYMEGHFNQGHPDAFDLKSEVLVAVENGEVIAGARLTASCPLYPQMLPSETPGKSFQDMLPEYCLGNAKYGEVHRVVIKEEKRSTKLLCDLLVEVCRYIHRNGWDYFFTPSIPLKARLYKICCRSIGVNLESVPGFLLKSEKYAGVAMELMVCDTKKQKLYAQLSTEMARNTATRLTSLKEEMPTASQIAA